MYEDGQGVAQDYSAAAGWYRRSAMDGYFSAQNNLGILYGNGLGVEQDLLKAGMWLNIAEKISFGEERDQIVMNRDSVIANLNEEQLAQAQAMADKCLESRYRDCE